MNKHEKELLLKDLCARFTYGVIVRVHDIEHRDFDSYVDSISNACIETHPVEEPIMDFNPYVFYKLQEVKPYLRPMNSMTEEEREEWANLFMKPICELEQYTDEKEAQNMASILYGKSHSTSIDWLNKKMFDYHGLIPMGIALEAPEGMYK